MMIVGLTGGIGSGKTTVADFFKDLGIPIYIADEEAKKLMLKESVKFEIITLLGEKSYDSSGKPNRKFIASQVFEDKILLEKLNGIIHPKVRQHFKKWAEKQDAAYVIYEAAILFETQKYKQFDHSILVTAPKKIRMQRLKARDNSTEKEIEARMQNQWSDARKKNLADFVIKNTDLTKTKVKVSKIHCFLLTL